MVGYILNFFGGFVRWIFGYLYRTLANKPKFKFREYIYGPENSDDWFDLAGHGLNNRVIGLGAIILICWIITEF